MEKVECKYKIFDETRSVDGYEDNQLTVELVQRNSFKQQKKNFFFFVMEI